MNPRVATPSDVPALATKPGEPFYAALGFEIVERVLVPLPGDVEVPFARMRRPIER